MKPYFFTLNQGSRRTGTPIAKICGVVFASDETEAGEKAWALRGNDAASCLQVYPVPDEGFSFTVYKSEI